MDTKKLKRALIFSNERTYNYCDSVLNDLSQKYHSSPSKIIEGALLEKILSDNEDINRILTNILYSDDCENPINESLDCLFSMNASGKDWYARHNNLKSIVEFAKHNSPHMFQPDVGFDYLISQWEDIAKTVNDYANNTIDFDTKVMNLQSARQFNQVLERLKSNREVDPVEMYILLLEWWGELCNWSITYKCLMELARITPKWTAASDKKVELLELLIKVGNKWQNEEPVYYFPWRESDCSYIDWNLKKPDPTFTDDDGISVYANDVFVGHLSMMPYGVMWNPGLFDRTVRYAIKDKAVFPQIFEKIKSIAFKEFKATKLFFYLGPLMSADEWASYGVSLSPNGRYYELDSND